MHTEVSSGMISGGMSLVGMFGIGPTEMLVVCVVGLLLFGSRVPEAMRGMGRGIKEFKDGVRGIESDLEKEASP